MSDSFTLMLSTSERVRFGSAMEDRGQPFFFSTVIQNAYDLEQGGGLSGTGSHTGHLPLVDFIPSTDI